MVCYCPLRKILYLHVPKTGGLTIESILVEKYNFKYFTFGGRKNEFLHDKDRITGIFRYVLMYSDQSKKYDLNAFFKFTFVRHPHTRIISAIKYLHKWSVAQYLDFPKNLSDFYEKTLCDPYYYIHFNISQHDHLINLNGDITFDFIGRQETLILDLKHVLFDILKMPVENFDDIHNNKSIDNILTFNKDDVKEIADIIHEKDFNLFGYK